MRSMRSGKAWKEGEAVKAGKARRACRATETGKSKGAGRRKRNAQFTLVRSGRGSVVGNLCGVVVRSAWSCGAQIK